MFGPLLDPVISMKGKNYAGNNTGRNQSKYSRFHTQKKSINFSLTQKRYDLVFIKAKYSYKDNAKLS